MCFFVVTNLLLLKIELKSDQMLVVFVNGIPLVVFELKTAADEKDIKAGYRQIKNYQRYLIYLS